MNTTEFDKLTTGEQQLVMWQMGRSGGFISSLFTTMCKADQSNLMRLSAGFPSEVDAFVRYTTVSNWWQDLRERLEI